MVVIRWEWMACVSVCVFVCVCECVRGGRGDDSLWHFFNVGKMNTSNNRLKFGGSWLFICHFVPLTWVGISLKYV